MDTFLPPIENPPQPMMKLVYALTRRQFGKVRLRRSRPRRANAARFRPVLRQNFRAGQEARSATGNRDDDPRTGGARNLLLRNLCIDIGRSFAIKASMNEAKFDALENTGRVRFSTRASAPRWIT